MAKNNLNNFKVYDTVSNKIIEWLRDYILDSRL